MFSYFGSKSKIVNLYPAPKYDLIIEPFAGSARYSLKYFERDVVLVDKYKVIIDVWKYLQQASEKDILDLPIVKQGESITSFNLSYAEKLFLGFVIKGGDTSPALTAGSFTGINVARNLRNISRQLFKIRHWKFIHGTYECLQNTQATWFIDPPYFKGCEHYRHSTKQIDFESLAEWCKKRNGQAIVCENDSANWLPFLPLRKMRGSMKTTYEVFWTNENVEYQPTMF
jgi:hypothetical protein